MTATVPPKATHQKSAFRMECNVQINIASKPERIWKLLTTAQDFPRWNSTIVKMQGQFAVGEKIELVAASAPGRTFKPKITELQPNQKMVWSDGMAPMFKGVRVFTLTPRSDGSTDFGMNEVFQGLMLPMIAGSLPDFVPVFEQYATDLKREAEGS